MTRSNTFIDAEGTGLLHHTAWAGVGTGVLFFDPKNLGAITSQPRWSIKVLTKTQPLQLRYPQVLSSIRMAMP